MLAVISTHKPTGFSFRYESSLGFTSNVYLLIDINSSPIMRNRAIEFDNLCGDVCHGFNWNASRLDNSETTYDCCRCSGEVWSRKLREWRSAKINRARPKLPVLYRCVDRLTGAGWGATPFDRSRNLIENHFKGVTIMIRQRTTIKWILWS